MRNWVPALALSMCLALPGQGHAQIGLLFDTPHLAAVEPGSSLNYAVSARRTDADSGEATMLDGAIRLTASPSTEASRRTIDAELTRNGKTRSLDAFSGVSGNPIFIIFLEQITQDLARATGGSPSYLRKRIRAGLKNDLTAETSGTATRMVMRPLDGDPNADALGGYANLEIAFELDTGLPGMFRELSAVAGPDAAPLFLEEVIYDPNS